MDRFAQLAAFVRTVDRGNQAAAAQDLGITPAMVGRHINALENRLGTRLLNRTTATQSLTEPGTTLHAQATAILEQLEAAENDAADRQTHPTGTLRINAPMVFGVRHLAAAVASFLALHPALQIDLVLNDRLVDLVEEGYDLAIRIGRLPDSTLVTRRLAPCKILLCAAPAYLAKHGTPTQPDHLRHHNCLLYTYSPQASTWPFRLPNGRETRIQVQGNLVTNNGDALLAAAIQGAGLILQPTFIVADAIQAGLLVPLLPDYPPPDRTIQAVYPSTRHLAPKVRTFIDHLAKQAF